MKRYGGEDLISKPHIVVLGSCKVGNFVVSTPVLRGLKARFRESIIGFIGSDVTADFERSLPSIDWRVSWDDPSLGAGLQLQQTLANKIDIYGQVQLALNLDGFNPVTCSLVPWLNPVFVAGGSLKRNLRSDLPSGELPQQRFLTDSDWDSQDFFMRYSTYFSSNYIAELFCQMAFVGGHVNPKEIELPIVEPPFLVPDLLIHCTTVRQAKVWPFDYWQQVIEFAESRSWTVGLVGSSPLAQREAYNSGDGEELLLARTRLLDLRGSTSLLQLAGAAKKAKAVISVDAGPLHIAAAVGTPTLAIVGNDEHGIGASPIRLWLPRCSNVSRTIAENSCSVCSQNKFHNDDCLVEGHICMRSVKPRQVINWLSSLMSN